MKRGTKGQTHNIVCISTIDWDFNWQGHQEIMSTLAKQGHRVLFIENTGIRHVELKDLPRLKSRLLNWRKGTKGIRKVMENLYVYAPLVLPFPYSGVARVINRTLMFWTLRNWTKTMRFGSPIVWTWLPTPLALDIIRFLDGQMVVYYCCDNFEATSASSRRVRESENVLLRKADLVFAHSKWLFDRSCRFASDVHIFQYGFNEEVFTQSDERIPVDLASISRPILGYVGGVHRHVDLELLKKVARAHSDKSLVLVGPLQVAVGDLAEMPNVHFLGQKKYEELPSYIRCFDVGLIPYALNDYTRSVYPTKLNEYLIVGKPVVSTKLPEVEYFNQCHRGIVNVVDGHEAFIQQIQQELNKDQESLRIQRINQVKKNAWRDKIGAMQGLIQAKLDEKAKSRELNWQDSFARVFRESRRKFVVLGMACFLAYLLVFYTSLLWELGAPLWFVDAPQRADAIVVLAGGVGESGDASDVYQEKVQYGVDLYRQGYGRMLVFSSGAHYVFKEAQVMKALAMALGVPEQVVLLDEVGGGCYGSILNAKRLAREQGWTSILVVTSRYNTRRASLVAHANLLGLSVRVVAPSHSAFFGDREVVQWKHVRAIVHEYVAIAYYWAKRYI